MSEEATLDEFSKTTVSQGRQETPVGELPADWGIEWLKDVVEINPDGFSEDDWPSETFEYISLSEASEGEIEGSTTTPLEEAPSRAQRTVQRGDVLVGTVRPKQRSHGFVSEEHAGKICSSGFGVLRTESRLNSRYLLQEILSNRFFSQMEAYVAGSGYPAVKISDLKKHRVAIPPLPEQRKIATVLYTVDRAIEKTGEIIGQVEQTKQALTQSLFLDGYFDHRETVDAHHQNRLSRHPAEWQTKPAGEVMEVTRGAHPRPKSDDTLWRGEIPIVKIGDRNRGDSRTITSTDDTVTEKGSKKSKLVDKGTLIVSNAGTVGTARITGMQTCIHDHWLILRNYEESLSTRYLYYFINWNQEFLEALASGSTVLDLNTDDFRLFDITFPSLEEQQKIADTLDSLHNREIINVEYSNRLKRLKHGLMQDLLSGTVRTTDTNIEVPDEIAQHG